MEEYDGDDCGQAFLDYDEWSAAQDAPYQPGPADLGRCHSGLHDHDAGCLCSEFGPDDAPF